MEQSVTVNLVSFGSVFFPHSRSDYQALVEANYPLTVIPAAAFSALQSILGRVSGSKFEIVQFEDVARTLRSRLISLASSKPSLQDRVVVHPSSTADSQEIKFGIFNGSEKERLDLILASLSEDDPSEFLDPEQTAAEIAQIFESEIIEPLKLHLGKYQHKPVVRKLIREDGAHLYGISFAHDPELVNVRFFSQGNQNSPTDSVIVTFSSRYRMRFEMSAISVGDLPEPALKMQIEERHGDDWEPHGTLPRTFLLKTLDRESIRKFSAFLLSNLA